jgi:hypothetical protein
MYAAPVALEPQLVPLVFLLSVGLVLFTFVAMGFVFETMARSRSRRRRRRRHHRHRRHAHSPSAAAFVAMTVPHDQNGLGDEPE